MSLHGSGLILCHNLDILASATRDCSYCHIPGQHTPAGIAPACVHKTTRGWEDRCFLLQNYGNPLFHSRFSLPPCLRIELAISVISAYGSASPFFTPSTPPLLPLS